MYLLLKNNIHILGEIVRVIENPAVVSFNSLDCSQSVTTMFPISQVLLATQDRLFTSDVTRAEISLRTMVVKAAFAQCSFLYLAVYPILISSGDCISRNETINKTRCGDKI